MTSVWSPLWGLLFAVGGSGLAALWHFVSPFAAIGVALLVAAVGLLLERRGRRLIRSRPTGAIKWLECWSISIGAMTAAAAAIGILVGVNIATAGAAEGDAADVKLDKETTKAIVAGVATALAGFFAAITVNADGVDTAIGARVKKAFQRAYVGPKHVGDRARDATELAADSAGLRAVYTLFDPPDWDHDNRRLRAKRLEAALPPRSHR